jgi:hypothetical protein
MESPKAAAPAISRETLRPKLEEYYFSERTLRVLQREPGFQELGYTSHQIYFVNEIAQRHDGHILLLRQLSKAFECDAFTVTTSLEMDWMIHKAAVVILPLTLLQKSKLSSVFKIKQRNSIQSHEPTFSTTAKLNVLPLFHEGG